MNGFVRVTPLLPVCRNETDLKVSRATWSLYSVNNRMQISGCRLPLDFSGHFQPVGCAYALWNENYETLLPSINRQMAMISPMQFAPLQNERADQSFVT